MKSFILKYYHYTFDEVWNLTFLTFFPDCWPWLTFYDLETNFFGNFTSRASFWPITWLILVIFEISPYLTRNESYFVFWLSETSRSQPVWDFFSSLLKSHMLHRFMNLLKNCRQLLAKLFFKVRFLLYWWRHISKFWKIFGQDPKNYFFPWVLFSRNRCLPGLPRRLGRF